MGFGNGPKIVPDGLQLSYDIKNSKSYQGGNTVLYNAAGRSNNLTGTSLNSYEDPVAGNVIDIDATNKFENGSITPIIGKYSFSVIYWIRFKGMPGSNYVSMWRLIDTVNAHGYYFIADTRTAATPYVLQYVKDDDINLWDTRNLIGNSTWINSTNWWCLGLSMHAEDEWRSYVNGVHIGTNTASSIDLSGYGDIDHVRIGSPGSAGLYMGNFMVYNKTLSAEEHMQNFNALRGRYGV
tara:strand:- start:1462 stop:2175 length:714 start_codon:yes stop_codon:yes gene_type:complete